MSKEKIGVKDWDYVTMEDYDRDTKELVNIGNAVAEKLRRELKEARDMFYAAIATMGKIEINRSALIHADKIRIEQAINECEDKIMFKVIKP